MDFADLFDVTKTMEEFRKEWLLRYTPNDFKFWAPRLESDIPAEKVCASLLLKAWGCDHVLTQYENWVALRNNEDVFYDQYQKAMRRESYDSYESEMYWEKYNESLMSWSDYLNKSNNVIV